MLRPPARGALLPGRGASVYRVERRAHSAIGRLSLMDPDHLHGVPLAAGRAFTPRRLSSAAAALGDNADSSAKTPARAWGRLSASRWMRCGDVGCSVIYRPAH